MLISRNYNLNLMFVIKSKNTGKDCLTNLFIHESQVVLSFYFTQATSKRPHPSIKRLYYPVGEFQLGLQNFQSLLAGTVFEIGSQKMEIHSVHHARAPIQWLKEKV